MGTKEGSIRAVKTIYARHGRDHFARIGAIGGRRGHTGGFYANRKFASIAGRLGGQLSRRGYKLDDEERHRIRCKYEREYKKAHEELMAVHMKAKREREAYAYA
jgi:uncharacterized protein